MTAQTNISIRKRKTSEILAIAASEILFAIDIADTFILISVMKVTKLGINGNMHGDRKLRIPAPRPGLV